MAEGPIKHLIQAAILLRYVLHTQNVDLEGAEVVIRLKSDRDAHRMDCAIRADSDILPIITNAQIQTNERGAYVTPFAGLRFTFEGKDKRA